MTWRIRNHPRGLAWVQPQWRNRVMLLEPSSNSGEMAWKETAKLVYSQQPEDHINSTRFFGFLSLAYTRKPGTSTTVIRSIWNSIAQVLFFLQQLTAQAIRNCKEDFRPVQRQCSHTLTLHNKATNLKILPIFTTLFVHLLSSCLYCKWGKISYFCMTAWTVLGSQLSPRHLWFVLGPLFLADPFILQAHWIVSVLH